MTQAKKLIQAIRKRGGKGLTYGELEALKVSTCPWRRITESGASHLMEGEVLQRLTGDDGLVRFVIVKRAAANAPVMVEAA